MVTLTAVLIAAGLLWRVPATVRQGDTVRVEVERAAEEFSGAAVKAPWKDAPFFRDGAGRYLALVPVPVRQDAGEYALTAREKSGRVIREFTVRVLDAKFPRQNIQVTPAMQGLQVSDDEGKLVAALLGLETLERSWQEPFRKPARGCMNSRFGVLRFHNGVYAGRYHGGVDQRGAAGTPVYAAAAGVVRIARKLPYRGGTVGIDHGQGVVTMYLHLSRIDAKEGAVVLKGERIGGIGATGFATGPHLHWSLFVHGVSVNPLQWTPGVAACGISGKRR